MGDREALETFLPVASQFHDHGIDCCSTARRWLGAMDRSRSFRDSGWHPPTWLRDRYSWGPIHWPIFWCQVPAAEVLDCGALAALATELFRARGEVAGSVQLILRYPRSVAAGWAAMWARAGLLPTWIHEEYCYHEATAIVRQDDMAIWDPTESRWVESDAAIRQIYGGLVAIRVGSDQLPADSMIWCGRVLPVGEWIDVREGQRHAEPAE